METAKTSIDVRRAYGIIGRLHVSDELHEAIFNGPFAMMLWLRCEHSTIEEADQWKVSQELWDAMCQLELHDKRDDIYRYTTPCAYTIHVANTTPW